MNKIITLFIFLIFHFEQLLAQSPSSSLGMFQDKPATIGSPNASALEMFEEFQVSLFTGVPNITVPLYNITESGFSVPISLSYHASGFRPDAHPGWVGSGWTIFSGGAINRKVKDLPDEYDIPISTTSKAGYYYHASLFDVANWNSSAFVNSLFTISSGNSIPDVLRYDTEADEFSFQAPGISGSFFLNEKHEWKVRSDEDLKVVFNTGFLEPPFSVPHNLDNFWVMSNNGNFMSSFSGFSIIKSDGTTYVFGGSTNEIEYSMPIFNQIQSLWVANSWQLKKIILVNGREINFSYERIADRTAGKFICSMFESIFVVTNSSTTTRAAACGHLCCSFPQVSSRFRLGWFSSY